MDREQAIQKIKDSELAEYADLLIEQLAPSVRLVRGDGDANELGASRLGGLPDLPPGLEWPVWTTVEVVGFLRKKRPVDRSLHFLLQVRIADLPPEHVPEELPRAGMLYFFYDVDEQPWGLPDEPKGGFRVLFHEGPVGDLAPRSAPGGVNTFPAYRLTAVAEWILPGETDLFDKLADTGVDEDALNEQFHEFRYELIGEPPDVVHRMFGHAEFIQNDLELGPEQFLLLQLDTDDRVDQSPGWMWGDCGRLYFWMQRTEASERAFHLVKMELQCY